MVTTNPTIRFEKRATDLNGWYYRSDASPSSLRHYMRQAKIVGIKQAELGGDEEQGFEKAFSSLAYSHIRDAAPRLVDYLAGFQLVDRNEDNSKAVGLFGFKVGGDWLYAPVFFLNGDLKGHELLYVKRKDIFCPLKENWINLLIARKPRMLGGGSARDTFQLGGLPPDLNRFTRPPTTSKYGSAKVMPNVQSWAVPFLEFFGKAVVDPGTLFDKFAGLDEKLNLPRFLGENLGLAQMGLEMANRFPWFKVGCDRFHGKDMFAKLAAKFKQEAESFLPTKTAADWHKDLEREEHARMISSVSILGDEKPPEPKIAAVTIITKEAVINDVDNEVTITRNLDDLTEEDRKKLMTDTILIKDERDPHAVSVAYNTQVRMELTNPSETGIYEVLEKPGSFEKMLVIVSPHKGDGRESEAIVIRMGDQRAWMNAAPTTVWVKGSPGPARDELYKYVEGLSDVSSLQKGAVYVAIGCNGSATHPFRIEDEVAPGKYEVRYEWGHGGGYMDDTICADRYRRFDRDYDWGYRSSNKGYGTLLNVNQRSGSGLTSVQGEISVPKEFKVIKLKDPPKPSKMDDDDGFLCGCSEMMAEHGEEGSDPIPIELGNIAQIQMDIEQLLGWGDEKTAGLRLIDQGPEVWVKSRFRGTERMSKKAALISLVRDHGLREKQAREMLKEMTAKGKGSWLIKYADQMPSGPLQPGPNAPAFPAPMMGSEPIGYGSVSSIYPQEEIHRVPGMSSSRTNPIIYDPFYKPDGQAQQIVQRAAQTGQREVFDTTSIAGLVKSTGDEYLIDRYLGDLMKAMDRLGRLLFNFYWHQDRFEDRFGKASLPELEDSLRNTFESLGDTLLFLKEKSVNDILENTPGGDAQAPDIEDVAAA